ncbi:MAG: hypothetical protein AABY22_10945 [Nanoarchaeota archaeon]
MKIQIEEKKCVSVEKTFHFKIKIDSDLFFIIIQTIDGIVVSQERGVTYWDCQKRLTKEQKKLIKITIERMF